MISVEVEFKLVLRKNRSQLCVVMFQNNSKIEYILSMINQLLIYD